MKTMTTPIHFQIKNKLFLAQIKMLQIHLIQIDSPFVVLVCCATLYECCFILDSCCPLRVLNIFLLFFSLKTHSTSETN